MRRTRNKAIITLKRRFRHLNPIFCFQTSSTVQLKLIYQRKLEAFGPFTSQTDYTSNCSQWKAYNSLNFPFISVSMKLKLSFLPWMALTTVQVVGKNVYIFYEFWHIMFHFYFQMPHGLMRKKRKKSKTRGVEGGRFDRRPPVFSCNTKNEGKKTPRSMIYMLLTHWANGDEDRIEATFSYKNRPAIFLLLPC